MFLLKKEESKRENCGEVLIGEGDTRASVREM